MTQGQVAPAATTDAKLATPHSRAGFRPDVEGLRAVAVVLVMLSHAGLSWFEGGYVGVDVFFVISGFLITQMLARELRSTGRLRMRRFYARRARRLLPASAAVLVASALLTWAFLPKNRWLDTGYDIIASAVYGINWRLAAESVDYLNADAAPSIVQHFWSLAVEEQFYILWPCLLVGAAGFARWRGHRSPRGAFLLALALVGVPSLAWSLYYTVENPARAYFVSTTRLWELALGAALAILIMNGRSLPRTPAFLLGWAGMGAIVTAGVLFTTEFAFPGYWALVPTVGAAAVIAAGVSPAGRGRFSVGGLLATGPMVTIGGLSYSLYLCHWPVVVVATAVLGELSLLAGLAAVALSFIPAYLLHHHVENPIRFSRTRLVRSSEMLRAAALLTVVSLVAAMALQLASWPPPPRFVPPAITKLSQGGAAGIGGGSAATGSRSQTAKPDPKANPNAVLGAAMLADDPLGDQNGAPKDTVPTIVPTPDSAANDYFPCTQSQESSEIRTCTHGKKGSSTKIVVVGDSHANQWVPALAEIAEARGWELIEYTKAACSFADVLVTTKEGQPYPSCQQWGAAVMDRLLTVDKPKMVVTSEIKKRVWLDGRAVYTEGGLEALVGGLKRYWERLTAAGIPVVALQDTPQPQVNVPECVQTNPKTLTKCAADRSIMLPGDHGAELIAAAEGMKDVRLVDMNDAVCPTEQCAPVIGNVLVYRDTSHVSGTYVRTLGPRLEERVFGVSADGRPEADGRPKSADPAAGKPGPVAAKPDPAANPNAVLGAALLADEPRGDQNGAPKDSYPTIQPAPEVAVDDYTDCVQAIERSDVRSCTYGARDSSTVVAVVGDSHANQWVAGLSEVAEARGWTLREYTKAACSFSDVMMSTKEGQPYTSCQEWNKAVLERLLTTEKPTFVINAQLKKGTFVDGELRYDTVGRVALAAGLRRTYEALTKAGIPVIALQDSPTPGIDIPECVQSNPDKLTACATDRSAVLPADHGLEQVEAAKGLPNVRVIDVNDAICPTDRCAPVIGNVLVYRDTSHLTGTYVRTLVPRLDAAIGEVPR